MNYGWKNSNMHVFVFENRSFFWRCRLKNEKCNEEKKTFQEIQMHKDSSQRLT
jgi:hypothetical protein